MYKDQDSKSHEEVLKKAEKFLREVNFPECFDKKTMDALEEEYRELELS